MITVHLYFLAVRDLSASEANLALKWPAVVLRGGNKWACSDRIKSVASCMFRRETFMDTLSFRKKQSPSLRIFHSILNINISWITSHQMCLKIPLLLDTFQLLRQTFSFAFVLFFCATIDQDTLISLKNNYFTTLALYINLISIFCLWLTGYKNV